MAGLEWLCLLNGVGLLIVRALSATSVVAPGCDSATDESGGGR